MMDHLRKVHLYEYIFLPHITCEQAQGPRYEFLYFSDLCYSLVFAQVAGNLY